MSHLDLPSALVTYHCNTFNRRYLLENMLRSFEACNAYEGPHEWIITDYGSTDGTRGWLTELAQQDKRVTVVLGSEEAYAEHMRSTGASTTGKRLMYGVMGMARNVALSMARGEWLIDIADDHQFIRRGDWVTDAMTICVRAGSSHREPVGDCFTDVSSVIYRGLSRARLDKPNNARSELINVTGTEFYLSGIKGYDDYGITHRDVHEEIGRYLQPDELWLSDRALREWNDETKTVTHYVDYVNRATKLGYKKAFLKIPYAVDFPNWMHAELNTPAATLKHIVPLYDTDELAQFSTLDRPVSSDELMSRKAL